MNSIICPKCERNLEPVVYNKIEVDRCPNCAGIWFDSLEAEQLKKIKGSEKLDISAPNANNPYDRLLRKIACPKCSTTLIRMLDIDKHSIWYEKCPACQGVWLDAGEFQKFKQNFQSKGILRLFRFRRK